MNRCGANNTIAMVEISRRTRIRFSPVNDTVACKAGTRLYTESMTDWDAAKYHRISDPQLTWGRAVAMRLVPVPGERILDIGCGTGRLTSEIAARPAILVVGLDRSAAMLQEAAKHGAGMYVLGDGAALPFA